MRRRDVLTRLILLGCVLCVIAPAARTDGGRPEPTAVKAPRAGTMTWEPYTLETYDGGKHDAELGRLWVPEDRTKSGGRLIRIAVVRLRATTPEPGPPILFLAGGPGIPGTGLGRVPVYFRLFDRLRTLSDVLLLDMRGTGRSTPNLEWRDERPMPSDVFASEAKAAREITRRARACARYWRGKGVDLGAYNTLAIADDVEDLRRALGCEWIRLLGWSYGTEAALTVLRRHGRHVDRAALAGTRGPDHVLKLPSATELLLKRVARLAQGDPAAPDVVEGLRRLLERLDQHPVEVPVAHRPSGRRMTLTVGRIGLQAVVTRLLSDGGPLLPALVTSLSQGDTTLFGRQLEPLYNGFTSLSGMNLAVNASAGWSREREARVRREAKETLLGEIASFPLREIRRRLALPDVGPVLRTPVSCGVPTLFVSGSLDGTTPPYQAEEVRWGFAAGVHLIVENGGHETLPAPEVQEAVTAFFRGEDVAGRRILLPSPRFLTVAEALGK